MDGKVRGQARHLGRAGLRARVQASRRPCNAMPVPRPSSLHRPLFFNANALRLQPVAGSGSNVRNATREDIRDLCLAIGKRVEGSGPRPAGPAHFTLPACSRRHQARDRAYGETMPCGHPCPMVIPLMPAADSRPGGAGSRGPSSIDYASGAITTLTSAGGAKYGAELTRKSAPARA